CKVHAISLVCSEAALQARLIKDVEAGIRTEDIIKRSVERLPLYEKLNTIKVDVSDITPEQAADYIIRYC
ncbi:MAG TPA: nucleotide kinase, partial [Bacillota bacterium]|nr:nucleotide kinase [Bacillota bacterium]